MDDSRKDALSRTVRNNMLKALGNASASDIARSEGLPISTLSSVLEGRHTPSLFTIACFCTATGTTPNEIMGWK